jgi:hypothetical protein
MSRDPRVVRHYLLKVSVRRRTVHTERDLQAHGEDRSLLGSWYLEAQRKTHVSLMATARQHLLKHYLKLLLGLSGQGRLDGMVQRACKT